MKNVRMTLTVITAVIMAAAGSAFRPAQTSYYWFPVDVNGNPQPVSTLLFEQQSSDPYGCANQTITKCAKGYTSYTRNALGQYIPLGALVATITKAD
jgi:hypothetical protein